jgi:phenylalanyl-tRNA synthetase beta chain
VLARFGVLHPATLAAFDIDVPVVVAEIYLDAIPAKKGASGLPASTMRRPHFRL